VEQYHEIREEIQQLQDEAKQSAQRFLDDERIAKILAMDISEPPDQTQFILNQPQNRNENVTISQLESALRAKWKSISFPFRTYFPDCKF